MSYKILTKNGVENTNIDGARDNFFNSGMRDGIVQGILNEGVFASNASNSVYLDTCELRIIGHRVVIDEAVYQTFSSKPSIDKRYSFVAQIKVDDSSNVDFSIIIQDSNTNLIKENLYSNQNGVGTYQVEIGRFTQLTDGTITDVIRTIDVITGGTGKYGGKINIGNVVTEKIDPTFDAEVDIDQRYDEESQKEYIDFKFSLPIDMTDTIDKSNKALENSQSALNNSNNALNNSNQALENSNQALEKSNTAVSTANSASAKSDTAIETANNAESIANGIDGKATQAIETANSANEKADTAINTASSANTKADSALSTANSANSKADTALGNSNTAMENASTAVETASQAKSESSSAVQSATSAVSTANSANSKADTAISNSQTAMSNANTAITTSNQAKETAEQALEQVTAGTGTRVTVGGKVQDTWNADSKVDKVDGKGLSTNDFTDEEKNKLDSIDPTKYVTTDTTQTITGSKNFTTRPRIESENALNCKDSWELVSSTVINNWDIFINGLAFKFYEYRIEFDFQRTGDGSAGNLEAYLLQNETTLNNQHTRWVQFRAKTPNGSSKSADVTGWGVSEINSIFIMDPKENNVDYSGYIELRARRESMDYRVLNFKTYCSSMQYNYPDLYIGSGSIYDLPTMGPDYSFPDYDGLQILTYGTVVGNLRIYRRRIR